VSAQTQVLSTPTATMRLLVLVMLLVFPLVVYTDNFDSEQAIVFYHPQKVLVLMPTSSIAARTRRGVALDCRLARPSMQRKMV